MHLEKITEGLPGITKAICHFMLEACIVCLSRHKHPFDGTSLLIQGDMEKTITLVWPNIFDEQMDRSWEDQDEATEYGAACLGIMIVKDNTPYTVIQRSAKETGIDYWLGHKDDSLIQKKARLEVSGIFHGANKVDSRFRAKIRQVEQSDKTGLPVYICVVEFGTPLAKFGEKK
jgi:cytosine/adenosine deaminase-related metal-dependent hydrolase